MFFSLDVNSNHPPEQKGGRGKGGGGRGEDDNKGEEGK